MTGLKFNRISYLLPVALIASIASQCDALPWKSPEETGRPTVVEPIAQLRPTTAPAIDLQQVYKRSFYPSSVCGFIKGSVGLVADCSTDSVCLWDTIHSLVGCSQTSGGSELAFYTTCLDHNSNENDPAQGSQWAFTCHGDDECYRNTYPAVSGQTFYQWGCGASTDAATVKTIPDGVNGQTAKVQFTGIQMRDRPRTSSSSTSSSIISTSTPSTTSSPPTTSSNPVSSSTSSNDDSSTSSTTPPPSSSSSSNSASSSSIVSSRTSASSTSSSSTGSSTSPPSSGSKSSIVGPIVGGVVGGVGGIFIIAGLIWFLIHRRRQANRRKSKAYNPPGGPQDMGALYEANELDAAPVRSELPGNDTLEPPAGPSKHIEPVELPGSIPETAPVGPPLDEKGFVKE